MASKGSPAPFDGLVIVDKPTDWTSHDVVGRLRRLVGTRRVGHGGTLDPMATGVLVCGVGKATKLLGLIGAKDKSYNATIRLGIATTTDDAQGEFLAEVGVEGLGASASSAIEEGVKRLTGDILQRPSSVSAIKVNGERAYKRVRAGEQVELAERPVTISQFDIVSIRESDHRDVGGPLPVIDVDVVVTCSTGTYIRALARDLGAGLGVGGHLTALRRTRVGTFDLTTAHTLEPLDQHLAWLPLDQVCGDLFPSHTLTTDETQTFRHGGSTDWPSAIPGTDTVAVFAPDQSVLGLAHNKNGRLAPTVVWQPA